MIKIYAHIPGRFDGTNFYRGSTPINGLRLQTKNEIDVAFASEYSFATVQGYDVAFFQRPCTPSELEAIRVCKRNNVPVVVDYDDLLIDLPPDNPVYNQYMNQTTRDAIIAIIREADLVWVSTKELKRCFQLPKNSLNEKIYVIPNALNDIFLAIGDRKGPLPLEKRQQAVMWRGSQTHHKDVMSYTPEIGMCADQFNTWSFIFAGWNPWFLTEHMRAKQAIVANPLPVGEFMDFIYTTAPQVGIVPLHDSRFNRCKSNCSWLEMTWAGAACLVPDWEEWQNPGAISYRTPEDFKAGLALLLEMTPEKRAELNTLSLNYIRENYLLSKVNELRYKTILAVIEGKNWPDGWQRLVDEDDKMVELE